MLNKKINSNISTELGDDPLIFGKIDVKYPTKLPRIISKLSREFPIGKSTLNDIFSGEITIHQILLKYPDKNSDIRAMIDYINRRKLLE